MRDNPWPSCRIALCELKVDCASLPSLLADFPRCKQDIVDQAAVPPIYAEDALAMPKTAIAMGVFIAKFTRTWEAALLSISHPEERYWWAGLSLASENSFNQ